VTGETSAERPTLVHDGRYQLTDRLDHGGAAGVYLSFDRSLKTWRAVKLLRLGTQGDAGATERFDREVRVLARLKHPRIVRVVETHREPTSALLVMELATGGTAAAWLETFGPMPPRLAAHVAVQVCEGLCVAHAAGIAHRDVTPASVLFDASGSVRLGNFHFAEGDISGTTGQPVDPTDDIASAVRLLYILCTGHTPPRDQPVTRDGLPAPLASVLERSTAGDFTTVEALADGIDQALALLPDISADAPRLNDALIRVPDAPPPLQDEEVLDYSQSPRSERQYDLPHHRGLTPAGRPPRTGPPALLDTPTGASSTADERHPTPSHIPYQLPNRPKRSQREAIERRIAADAARRRGVSVEDDDRPEWVDATPLPTLEQDYTITPAVQSGRVATPAPAAPRSPREHASPSDTPHRQARQVSTVHDPLLGEVVEDSGVDLPAVSYVPEDLTDVLPRVTRVDDGDDDGGISTMLVAAGLLTLCIPLFLGAGVYLGSLSVTEAQITASRTELRFYNVIETQQDVIREIDALGGNTAALEAAFFAWDDSTNDGRRDTAQRYVETLSVVWDDTPTGGSSARTAERVQVIRAARSDSERAQAQWATASSNLLGAAAVMLRLAEPPPG
jgi:serine/threonine protein kinase